MSTRSTKQCYPAFRLLRLVKVMAVMKKKQNKQNINEIFPVLFKRTFHYSSSYWTDRNEYNSPGGETGFDENEMKLPTYWNTSFSRICLGMKIDQQLRFIVVNKQADSLYSLIANGKYRETSLGRNTWKEMVGANASLQKNCNKEGFNVVCQATDSPKARIGIVSNQQGSALVQEENLMIQTRVAMKQTWAQIMVWNTSKRWDTFWYNNEHVAIS